jgi:ABC-type transporter Mla subunit MlaD
MKCETTNTVLTLVLALLVVAGVIFALQSIFRTREFRTLQSQIIARQTNLNRLNLLLNEAIFYGKTHPDINRIVQPFEAKPVAR